MHTLLAASSCISMISVTYTCVYARNGVKTKQAKKACTPFDCENTRFCSTFFLILHTSNKCKYFPRGMSDSRAKLNPVPATENNRHSQLFFFFDFCVFFSKKGNNFVGGGVGRRRQEVNSVGKLFYRAK